MPAILSTFVLGQTLGLSASGFFAAGSAWSSPFAAMTAVEASPLPIAQRASVIGPMFFKQGRPAFLASILLGVAGYTTAHLTRPADTSPEHARALLIGAASLVVALPHTVIAMLPVYKQLGAAAEFKGTEHEIQTRWKDLIKRFSRGNALRLGLFSTAYLCGLYGLSLTSVTSFK